MVFGAQFFGYKPNWVVPAHKVASWREKPPCHDSARILLQETVGQYLEWETLSRKSIWTLLGFLIHGNCAIINVGCFKASRCMIICYKSRKTNSSFSDIQFWSCRYSAWSLHIVFVIKSNLNKDFYNPNQPPCLIACQFDAVQSIPATKNVWRPLMTLRFLLLHFFLGLCRGPRWAAPKCTTMTYWLFWIEATCEIAGVRTLTPLDLWPPESRK